MSTATSAARLVTDKHRARPQEMTVRAALRWQSSLPMAANGGYADAMRQIFY
jgi:hypothetical protein